MLITRYPTTSRYQPRTKEDCTPCPACGGLQCLCRPRFFAGQLLTEEDLNRLDRYIREKHRLHNRYLHGWGVVCGLEVSCHDCENKVRVSAGYALSPCGDDVVVCADDTVDVCALVKKCRTQERVCEPPRRGRDDCDDVEETWVLAVCYDEKPSRGITALRSTGTCCSACSGSGSHCGCGCHDHASGDGMKGSTAVSVKPTPAQCEPTVVCEGYRYDVYRLPSQDADEEAQGALAERFECCTRPYLDFVKELGQSFSNLDNATPADLFQLCCSMKARLREIVLAHPVYDCTLLDRLALVRCPSPNDTTDDAFTQALQEAFLEIVNVWFQGLLACICSVLLPPCPAPAADNCVPLASVTLRKRDCKILQVCNWTVHRKFATTFPNLQYWLSVLPFGRQLRALIERLCCELGDLFRDQEVVRPEGISAEQPGFSAAFSAASSAAAPRFTLFNAMPFATSSSRSVSNLVFESLTGRATPLAPQTLFRGLMGSQREGGEPLLRQRERENPLAYMLINQLARPLVIGAVPDGLMGAVKGSEDVRAADREVLKNQVDELRSTLAAQQKIIDALKERLDEEG